MPASLSRHRHALVMAQQPAPRPIPPAADSPPAIACVIMLAQPHQAMLGENLLGEWSAADDMEILDGAILDWPEEFSRPRWRSLQNLPRYAALPDLAWADITAQLAASLPVPRAGSRLDIGCRLEPGGVALVVFCAGPAAESLCRQLAPLGVAHTAITLPARDYTSLLERSSPSAAGGLSQL